MAEEKALTAVVECYEVIDPVTMRPGRVCASCVGENERAEKKSILTVIMPQREDQTDEEYAQICRDFLLCMRCGTEHPRRPAPDID